MWAWPCSAVGGARPAAAMLLGAEREAHAGAPAPDGSSYFLPMVSELARRVCRRWICKRHIRTRQDTCVGARASTARLPLKRLRTRLARPAAAGEC